MPIIVTIIITIIITIFITIIITITITLVQHICFGPTVYSCGYYCGLVAPALLVIGHIPTFKHFRIQLFLVPLPSSVTSALCLPAWLISQCIKC